MQSLNAIVGHNGFIGKNLSQFIDGDKYNSKNIKTLKNKAYKTIYCCAPGATKWQINKDPESDLQNIKQMLLSLKNAITEKIVLFSTIDVHTFENKVSYGGNRLFLEEQIRSIFDNALIVRLPGLFGPGLKKNTVYDLQNKRYEFVNINTSFQWLDVRRAIKFALKANPGIHELYPQPIETSEIIDLYFPKSKKHCKLGQRRQYEIMPSSGYFQSKNEVLQDMGDYLGI
jgi:nucleoside-diphosphate-sugar epimerase